MKTNASSHVGTANPYTHRADVIARIRSDCAEAHGIDLIEHEVAEIYDGPAFEAAEDEAASEEDGVCRPEMFAEKFAQNKASDAAENLAEFISERRGVRVKTRYGNFLLPIVEWWDSDGLACVSVDLPPGYDLVKRVPTAQPSPPAFSTEHAPGLACAEFNRK
jgi:hypothetical protein